MRPVAHNSTWILLPLVVGRDLWRGCHSFARSLSIYAPQSLAYILRALQQPFSSKIFFDVQTHTQNSKRQISQAGSAFKVQKIHIPPSAQLDHLPNGNPKHSVPLLLPNQQTDVFAAFRRKVCERIAHTHERTHTHTQAYTLLQLHRLDPISKVCPMPLCRSTMAARRLMGSRLGGVASIWVWSVPLTGTPTLRKFCVTDVLPAELLPTAPSCSWAEWRKLCGLTSPRAARSWWWWCLTEAARGLGGPM